MAGLLDSLSPSTREMVVLVDLLGYSIPEARARPRCRGGHCEVAPGAGVRESGSPGAAMSGTAGAPGQRPSRTDDPGPAVPFVDEAVPAQAHYLEVVAKLHRWTTIAMRATNVPVFGSARWCALDDEDPAKTHAAVRAALAWWVEQDRAAEQAAADHVAASHAISATLDWTATSREPSYEELTRRRP